MNFKKETEHMQKLAHLMDENMTKLAAEHNPEDLTVADRITGGALGLAMAAFGGATAYTGLKTLPDRYEKFHMMTDEGLKEVKIPTDVTSTFKRRGFMDLPDEMAKAHINEPRGIIQHLKNNPTNATMMGLGGLGWLLGANGVYNSIHAGQEKQEV